MRMPKSRRPKERAWELFNQRNFGMKEGSQNKRSWALASCTLLCISGYEMYMQYLRLAARGDTCAACEATRKRFRQRIEQKEANLG